MSYNSLAYKLPGFLKRHVLHFEAEIEIAITKFSGSLTPNARVLDAGAGEGRYAPEFRQHRYIGVDLGVGDAKWNYRRLDAVADLTALPFASSCFDAALNVVTLEHLKEPAAALREISRTLRPGAPFLLVAPHEWEVHQAPHDYFRYTRYGLAHLLEGAGFDDIEIVAAGGYFRLLSRRLLNGLQFFAGGARWVLFIPAALLLVPPALILPMFDGLDRERNFTLGYLCTAKRSS